jgi:hypothetical protein
MPSYEYSPVRIPRLSQARSSRTRPLGLPSGRPPILSGVSETGHERPRPSARSLQPLEGLLAWPDGIARLGVMLVVGVTVVFCLAYLPRALDRLGNQADRNSALSFADRDIAGGNSILPDQVAAYEARALIPEREPYRVVVGPGLTKLPSLPLGYADDWLSYFLMPRRQSRDARWIICLGCKPEELRGRYEVLWRDEIGVSIGRLRA